MSKKVTTGDFIARAKLVPQHRGKNYDYSKVMYVTSAKNVEIICPIHGSFWQTPGSHLKGYGCSACSGRLPLTNEEMDVRLSHRPIKRIGEIRGALRKTIWGAYQKTVDRNG